MVAHYSAARQQGVTAPVESKRPPPKSLVVAGWDSCPS